ncbi:hypothetical protein [Sandarakinorhabdus sp.]|uniref:hypothetical protein n=1 Tax=Sandarakinorhabdus sp. TaxID=1916663 RepID=UPI00286E0D33|nr:hypothetical protein [Sandarakinorhabdus sp.]
MIRIVPVALALAVLAPAALATAAFAQGVSGSDYVRANLRVGAPVFGPTGRQIAIVESVAKSGIVVRGDTGPVTVPRTAFGPGSKGLVLNYTANELAKRQAAQAAENLPQ